VTPQDTDTEPSVSIKVLAWGIAGLFYAFPVALIAFGSWQAWRVQQAVGYATTVGEVLHSEVERVRDEGSRIGEPTTYTYRPRVEYAYSVEGVHRVGSRVTILDEASSERWAEGIARRYAPGQRVNVRYDRAHPEQTYLIEGGAQVWPWVTILMGTLILLWFGMNWWRQRKSAGLATAAAIALALTGSAQIAPQRQDALAQPPHVEAHLPIRAAR
jgi:Protein of unknown function (DUF3592)